MNHVLDNPIYNALRSGHLAFAEGTENATYYQEEVAPFAGLYDHSQTNFDKLYDTSKPGGTFVVFTPIAHPTPDRWKLITQIDMYQMVFEAGAVPIADNCTFENLNETHVAEMLELVKLTQPGPFRSNTIALGNYTGVFQDNKLVSMAGHRFNPKPFVEISAVCTHPDHLGKGYAYSLLREQIKRIVTNAQTPFLHVRNDNEAAVKLYQKLGFSIRTDMIAYVLQKIK